MGGRVAALEAKSPVVGIKYEKKKRAGYHKCPDLAERDAGGGKRRGSWLELPAHVRFGLMFERRSPSVVQTSQSSAREARPVPQSASSRHRSKVPEALPLSSTFTTPSFRSITRAPPFTLAHVVSFCLNSTTVRVRGPNHPLFYK